jgi:hypothetical protein
MDYKYFFSSIVRIIFTPGKMWESVHDENRSVKYLRNSILFPFLFLIIITGFCGSLFFSNVTLTPLYSVFTAIRYFLLFLMLPFASAAILGEITKPLDLGKDFRISFRLTIFSLIPFFISQVASLLFESLIFVNILSVYGLYIFWTGAERMLNPPDYKKSPLLIANFIVVMGLYVAGDVVLKSVIDRIFYSFFA